MNAGPTQASRPATTTASDLLLAEIERTIEARERAILLARLQRGRIARRQNAASARAQVS